VREQRVGEEPRQDEEGSQPACRGNEQLDGVSGNQGSRDAACRGEADQRRAPHEPRFVGRTAARARQHRIRHDVEGERAERTYS
jgi:hypothetical protein